MHFKFFLLLSRRWSRPPPPPPCFRRLSLLCDFYDMESEDECLDDISRIHDELLGSIDDGGSRIDGDVRTEAEAGSGDDNGWAISGKSNSAKARNGTTIMVTRFSCRGERGAAVRGSSELPCERGESVVGRAAMAAAGTAFYCGGGGGGGTPDTKFTSDGLSYEKASKVCSTYVY